MVDPASFRVIADHARAVAFLLADGVFPSNDGRGYVLRRILRRAVRHAWLLGRSEPTLVRVVEAVIDTMGDVYPELRTRSAHLLKTTRVEEEAFLATIDGGLARFDQLAPESGTQLGDTIRGTISGEDAFRLYDTFGFPIDLTELMARERGYIVDIAGIRGGARGAAQALAGGAEVAASCGGGRRAERRRCSGSWLRGPVRRTCRSSATTRWRSRRR